jgi:hypothetical protein
MAFAAWFLARAGLAGRDAGLSAGATIVLVTFRLRVPRLAVSMSSPPSGVTPAVCTVAPGTFGLAQDMRLTGVERDEGADRACKRRAARPQRGESPHEGIELFAFQPYPPRPLLA